MSMKECYEYDEFSTVAWEWFETKKPQWKQSSSVRYANILNLYLIPRFGKRGISTITRNEVILYGNELLVDGGADKRGLSAKTVTGIISVMKNVFKYAVKIKGCMVNDIKGTSLEDYLEISFRQEKKQMRILSVTEQQKLCAYLYVNMNPCNLGIMLCIYTGLRIGEICALKWKDIFPDEQNMYVHQTMQRLQTNKSDGKRTEILITAPKSDCSIRRIPIPDNMMYLLMEYRKEDEAFLVTGNSDRYMEPRTMQNHFKAVTEKCGIRNVNFHVLRHTFATRCVEVGFDTKSLSEILGHATVNITLNRYVHPSMELKRKNMNMLSGIFDMGSMKV